MNRSQAKTERELIARALAPALKGLRGQDKAGAVRAFRTVRDILSNPHPVPTSRLPILLQALKLLAFLVAAARMERGQMAASDYEQTVERIYSAVLDSLQHRVTNTLADAWFTLTPAVPIQHPNPN